MRYLKLLMCVLLCLVIAGCTHSNDTEIPTDEISRLPLSYEKAMEDGEICILVDAGHGLSDVGAMNEENLGEVTEADINFAVASLFANELKTRGYTVIMSHDGETKPHTEYDDGENTYGPSERADFSNSTKADIFVSIHCDSFPSNTDVYGTRLYYADGTPNATALDKQLASSVGKALDTDFPDAKDVILKPMDANTAYTVLYKTVVPSLLVECGFITNKGDAEMLLDSDWQADFAASLANGIDKYFEVK